MTKKETKMEKSERRKKLEETMKKFNKDQKSEVFSLGSEIKELPVIPSGVKKIDEFLGGGFKCGGHTIIWSPSCSVGKTALMLTTIANAQSLGKLVCYVNTEKPIEPERFKFFGEIPAPVSVIIISKNPFGILIFSNQFIYITPELFIYKTIFIVKLIHAAGSGSGYSPHSPSSFVLYAH